MGDGGSYFLGFTLAAVSIVGPAKGLTTVSLLLPLLILSLPLADMSAVIMGRLREGRSPFYPDRRHLHHRVACSQHADQNPHQVESDDPDQNDTYGK